jgi:hypothetical protein
LYSAGNNLRGRGGIVVDQENQRHVVASISAYSNMR